jgi:Trp operon repressor
MSSNPNLRQIANLFSLTRNRSELEAVLSDLLTPAEVDDLAERWLIVSHLLEGKVQREINRNTGVSISKITRASHVLRDGGEGFRLLWKRKKRD